ncbi:hypothetical protein PoB_007020400 [Plakobranchus ocellatus]|uniref:Uncharacterized protein n=1 Tax=Plakobranchus ocellatus TaxID=259542 RepID=A0AAV4DHI4_9GAST|nr:hypothetical protein PoB_007020400 [Plakobranchus ocellatus]
MSCYSITMGFTDFDYTIKEQVHSTIQRYIDPNNDLSILKTRTLRCRSDKGKGGAIKLPNIIPLSIAANQEAGLVTQRIRLTCHWVKHNNCDARSVSSAITSRVASSMDRPLEYRSSSWRPRTPVQHKYSPGPFRDCSVRVLKLECLTQAKSRRLVAPFSPCCHGV